MKILLDENLPIKLKYKIIGYEIFTVRDMNWNSAKNGELLKLTIDHSFDIFITTDKNLQYQQNIPKIGIALIVLDVMLLKWSYIEPLIPKIMDIIPMAEKGSIYVIN